MKATALKQVSFDPSIFTDIETIDQAIDVIVTPIGALTPQHRWQHETEFLMELIGQWLRPKGVVLDYGCAIGRLAQPMIEKYNCTVVGVDLSPNMRALADSRVASDRFMALPPDMLELVRPCLCSFAVAVWTLQHVLDLKAATAQIDRMLMSGGRLFVVNDAVRRYVPIRDGWVDDGVDVRAVLRDAFTELDGGGLPGDLMPGPPDQSFWAIYQK